jgi:hypothetical protein
MAEEPSSCPVVSEQTDDPGTGTISTDYNDYPILRRVSLELILSAGCVTYIKTLKPQDIDHLAVEVRTVLENCSKSETGLSRSVRREQEVLFTCIVAIDHRLTLRDDSNAGAMVLLFRKTIMTPTNLQALLRITSASVRTGQIRCYAICLLDVLMGVSSIWSVKLNDGTYFATALICAYSKVMEDDATKKDIEHDKGCLCAHKSCMALRDGLFVTKDKPTKVLNRILDVDWTTVLQTEDGKCELDFCHGNHKMLLWINLHKLAVRVYREDPPNAHKARTMLAKLGACNELFCFVLRRIKSEEPLWLKQPDPEQTSASKTLMLNDLQWTPEFLLRFPICLTTLPNDRETNALMRRAYPYFQKAPVASAVILALNPDRPKTTTTALYETLCLYFEPKTWNTMKGHSEEQRMKLFNHHYLSVVPHPGTYKLARRTMKSAIQSKLEKTIGEGEMCANCYIMESDMVEDQNLMKCAWCRQITYCSRECQRDHWKKAHKKQCKKKVTKK